MAKLHIEFFSEALARSVSFEMFIPNDGKNACPKEKTRTLFLLHGWMGSAKSWGIEELAKRLGFAMVMPNGENAFYLDAEATGRKYATFLGRELVGYVRNTFGLAKSAEDTGICGYSMGGFGALHTALAFPESFGMAGAMSAALIIRDIAHMKPGEESRVANYAYYREVFGDLETIEESEANPEVLVKRLKARNGKFPKIYMCCGTEDFLIENNREMHRFLESENVSHVYEESPGAHDWNFWNEYLPKIAEWMFR